VDVSFRWLLYETDWRPRSNETGHSSWSIVIGSERMRRPVAW
jgi:hypothetical protein